MRVGNEEIINTIERVPRIKFSYAVEDACVARGGRGGERGEERGNACLMRRTEDVIQRDTEAESNISRRCTTDDVRRDERARSPRIIL